MLGALSVVAFWTFGFGILLGVGAVVAGVISIWDRGLGPTDTHLQDAVIGILSGVFGVAIGIVFLITTWPNL